MPDSNLAMGIASAAIGLITYAINRLRGKKAADQTSLIRDVVNSALHMLRVTFESNLEDVRTFAREEAWKQLARVGVPRNAATELIVSGAIEAGLTRMLEEVRAHDRLVELETAKAQAAIAATLQATADAAQRAIAEGRRPLPGPSSE